MHIVKLGSKFLCEINLKTNNKANNIFKKTTSTTKFVVQNLIFNASVFSCWYQGLLLKMGQVFNDSLALISRMYVENSPCIEIVHKFLPPNNAFKYADFFY